MRRHLLWQHLVALILVGVVALIRLLLDPLTAGQAIGSLFVLPTVASALLAGVGAALTATLGSVVAYLLIVHPLGSSITFGTADVIQVVSLGAVGLLVAVLVGRLRESQRRWEETSHSLEITERRLANALPVGRMIAWEWDADQDTLQASDSIQTVYGCASLSSTNAAVQIAHPDDRARYAQLLSDAHRRRTTYHGEFRVVRPDTGATVWVSEQGAPQFDANGHFKGFIGVTQDITERKRAENSLRESEQRFQTLADGSPVLLWVNGLAGCEFVNRAYLEFIGIDEATEVRGYDWSKFVHPDDVDVYLQSYVKAFDARADFTCEFRFRRADGQWRWMESGATPRFLEGRFVGYVGATIDITDRKMAEDALRAEDRRKDEFLAILAHELRNPLAPIRTGLELLRVGHDTPGVFERVRPMMERQIAHMVRLIDDLLEVSRITSGRIELRREPTLLTELVRNAVEGNRANIDAAGLHLTVKVPENPCLLEVDPTRFVQILSNVLHNASKFTPKGGSIVVRADVEPESETSIDPMLVLTVRDTGVGIPAEGLPRVFDMFSQGDGIGRGKAGLGIGLGLARRLIEMHGGRIDATSDGPGQGSTFTIRMPVLQMMADEDVPTPIREPRSISRRVLVIDDNGDAADMLASLVAALGGEAASANDGEEGLRLAASFRPDVVLLDIGMPKMDGYETCRRLRATTWGRTAHIVALTGWGQDRDKQRAAESGFDAHLTKPADPEVLERLLADAPVRAVESDA